MSVWPLRTQRSRKKAPATLLGTSPSANELASLAAVCRCGSRAEAARELGIPEHAVSTDIRSILRRLGVGSVAEAVWILWVPEAVKEDASLAPM